MKKNLFLPIIIAISTNIPSMGMEPQAGTVIPVLPQTGQFTTTGINPVHQPSGLEIAMASIGQTTTEIAQPTLISFAAGKAPWWALSAGTGYLLLFKCDACNPVLLNSCAAGAGFASGTQVTSYLKKISDNPTITTAAQAAVVAGCVGLSYTTNVALAQDAFFAMAQAIGINSAFDLATKLLSCKQETSTALEEKQKSASYTIPSWIQQTFTQGAEINLQAAFVQLLQTYDPITLLRIFLYEQTYRLSQEGYTSATQLWNFIKKNYKPLDPKKAACTII